jgi:hypothetical protein
MSYNTKITIQSCHEIEDHEIAESLELLQCGMYVVQQHGYIVDEADGCGTCICVAYANLQDKLSLHVTQASVITVEQGTFEAFCNCGTVGCSDNNA